MIALISLSVGTVFLFAVAINCWLAIRHPAVWWTTARAKITMRDTRQRLKTQHRKAQITRDAERIRHELFEEFTKMPDAS